MRRDAAVWLANHLRGPEGEPAPSGIFTCYWCGTTKNLHFALCPFAAAVFQLDKEAEKVNKIEEKKQPEESKT